MPHVQLKDFRMHYVERGGGSEPIIFVHGFISSYRWWRPTIERLPENIYHAYVIDLRGAGESEQIETNHTLGQYAEDLEEFVEAMGLERFILVGHSMGGGVSMQYALNHQERLKALILVDPLAPFGTKFEEGIADWINAQQGQPEGIRMLIMGAFATQPESEYMDLLVEHGVGWGRAMYLGTMDDMGRFNVSERLGEIQVPTLVTWGDKDTVVPFAGVADIFTRIPGCGLEIWHGVGHSGPIEIPDRFVELLTRFISEAALAKA